MLFTARRDLALPFSARGELLTSTYTMVLAGGRGSRLRELTNDQAKPAVPFAGHLRIIDFALSNCMNSGLRRIGVLTQYKAQSLIRHVVHEWGQSDLRRDERVEVIPAQQQVGDDWYVGTADAVRQNLQLLRQSRARQVLVLSGDHVYRMDYRPLLEEHAWRGADCTVAVVAVPAAECHGLGVVELDADRRITAFHEKPARPEALAGGAGVLHANMGIYVFDIEFLCAALAHDAQGGHDFGHDVLPRIVRHARVFGHDYAASCVAPVDGRPYWRDVGTLDAYWEANMDVLRDPPELDLDDAGWPIGSPHGPLPAARLADGGAAGLHDGAVALLAPGSRILRASVARSILFERTRVGEGSLVEDSLLLPGAAVGRNVVLRRAIVADGCVVPDGMKIGVHSNEDRAHFRVTERGVTLVTADMLAAGLRQPLHERRGAPRALPSGLAH